MARKTAEDTEKTGESETLEAIRTFSEERKYYAGLVFLLGLILIVVLARPEYTPVVVSNVFSLLAGIRIKSWLDDR